MARNSCYGRILSHRSYYYHHQRLPLASVTILTAPSTPPHRNIPRNHSYFCSPRLTLHSVHPKPLPVTSTPMEKTTPACPATLSKFLNCNHHFASTCDPKVLENCSKGQAPSLFWLGCSDSRVPEGVVIEAQPGEVFVHRNVANVFNPEDTSALAALAYAVNHLKVSHVVVVGHESCGGCQAALSAAISQEAEKVEAPKPNDLGEAAIAQWIQPIKEIALKEIHNVKEDQVTPFDLSKLVKLNVKNQVNNIVNHEIIQKAWARGQHLSVHGWVYDLSTGKLDDLGLHHFKP